MAVRLPKAWIGDSAEVEMELKGDDIILHLKHGDPWTVAEACGRYGKETPNRIAQSKTGVRVKL